MCSLESLVSTATMRGSIRPALMSETPTESRITRLFSSSACAAASGGPPVPVPSAPNWPGSIGRRGRRGRDRRHRDRRRRAGVRDAAAAAAPPGRRRGGSQQAAGLVEPQLVAAAELLGGTLHVRDPLAELVRVVHAEAAGDALRLDRLGLVEEPVDLLLRVVRRSPRTRPGSRCSRASGRSRWSPRPRSSGCAARTRRGRPSRAAPAGSRAPSPRRPSRRRWPAGPRRPPDTAPTVPASSSGGGAGAPGGACAGCSSFALIAAKTPEPPFSGGLAAGSARSAIAANRPDPSRRGGSGATATPPAAGAADRRRRGGGEHRHLRPGRRVAVEGHVDVVLMGAVREEAGRADRPGRADLGGAVASRRSPRSPPRGRARRGCRG